MFSADAALSRIRLASPSSTFLFRSDMLETISDPSLRTQLVRRILRHVSPQAWGSPSAEAYGRHSSLERIVSTLWDTTKPSHERTRFSAGAKVCWSPVVRATDGRVYLTRFVRRSGEAAAWIAHREKPAATEPNTLTRYIDVDKLGDRTVRGIMYDNRFAVRLKGSEMPIDLHQVDLAISSRTPWFLPEVVWRKRGSSAFYPLYAYPTPRKKSFSAFECPSKFWAPGVEIMFARPTTDF